MPLWVLRPHQQEAKETATSVRLAWRQWHLDMCNVLLACLCSV